MNKFHFGTMEEIQRKFKCCDDPNQEEGERSFPPDDDFIIEYNCINCGKRTLDHYKLTCMEEIMGEAPINAPNKRSSKEALEEAIANARIRGGKHE